MTKSETLKGFFDYSRLVENVLNAYIYPFKLTGVQIVFWYDIDYYTTETEVVIANIPDLSYKAKEDSANFVGLSPVEICERVSEPFRLKLAEWWSQPRDILDTIELGEN